MTYTLTLTEDQAIVLGLALRIAANKRRADADLAHVTESGRQLAWKQAIQMDQLRWLLD